MGQLCGKTKAKKPDTRKSAVSSIGRSIKKSHESATGPGPAILVESSKIITKPSQGTELDTKLPQTLPASLIATSRLPQQQGGRIRSEYNSKLDQDGSILSQGGGSSILASQIGKSQTSGTSGIGGSQISSATSSTPYSTLSATSDGSSFAGSSIGGSKASSMAGSSISGASSSMAGSSIAGSNVSNLSSYVGGSSNTSAVSGFSDTSGVSGISGISKAGGSQASAASSFSQTGAAGRSKISKLKKFKMPPGTSKLTTGTSRSRPDGGGGAGGSSTSSTAAGGGGGGSSSSSSTSDISRPTPSQIYVKYLDNFKKDDSIAKKIVSKKPKKVA